MPDILADSFRLVISRGVVSIDQKKLPHLKAAGFGVW